MSVPAFYIVRDAGNRAKREHWVEPLWSYIEGEITTAGESIAQKWPTWSSHSATCESIAGFPDFPLMIGSGTIVSDRVRKVLDREVPGTCEFYPVTVVDAEERSPDIPYWLLNVVRILQRVPRRHTDPIRIRRPDGRSAISYGPRLDRSQMPSDAKIGRLRGSAFNLVFREDLVEAIEQAGLTGFRFVEVEWAE